ncbi:MAG: hypothetical protein QM681_04505 [Novosphingobium sp.]
MGTARNYFQQHYRQAIILVLLALCLKLFVPTGFMIGQDHSTFTVKICNDATGGSDLVRIIVPLKNGMDPLPGKPAKGECPFAALSMHALSGADPILLALAIAFIMALGLARLRPTLWASADHLRPPLRGPPA